MKLEAASGASVELAIQRYQYPDAHEDFWDSNWLVVAGTVRASERAWQFLEPCLTTFELADLADWLARIRSGDVETDTCTFTEPNIAFSYSRSPAPILRVRLAQECAPPWLTDQAARQAGLTVIFPISREKLDAAVSALRAMLAEYPIRGGAA